MSGTSLLTVSVSLLPHVTALLSLSSHDPSLQLCHARRANLIANDLVKFLALALIGHTWAPCPLLELQASVRMRMWLPNGKLENVKC